MRELLQKQCEKCKIIFYTRATNAKYCSKECRPIYEDKRREYTKQCKYCGSNFTSKDPRVKHCNLSCATKHSFEKRKHLMKAPKYKQCEYCGVETYMYPNQKFCCQECKGKHKYHLKLVTTETQYKKISGNWKQYFLRLVHQHKRKKDGLTRDHLLNLLKKQNYKCALTGVELTCKLERGVTCKTNASIDRINAGEKYTPDNIQLVCKAINSFRNDLSIDEFIEWCAKVVEYNKK